jgi:ubiquinone/menaquinone biosynthesis C-methylase UbiE
MRRKPMNDEYFKTRYSYDKGRNKVWRAICCDLQKYISPKATVLDLGCGYCDFINNIQAIEKIAVDISTDSKNYCLETVNFYLSPSNKLNFLRHETVDVTFSSNLFEHLEDQILYETLQETFRITAKGGKLILLQPNFKYSYKDYFDDYTHKKVFTHISLADCVRSFGFKLEKSYHKYLPFTFKSLIPKSYWLTRCYLMSPFKPMAKQMLLIFKK